MFRYSNFQPLNCLLSISSLWIIDTDLFNSPWSPKSGVSVLALAAIVVPITYGCYKLYWSEPVRFTSKTSNVEELDPEVVKDRTEQWSEEAAINPAFPPGQGPEGSTPDGSHLAPTNQSNKSVASTDDGSRISTNNSGIKDSALEFNWLTETGVSFADVGGMEALKDELRRDVITPLSNREQAEDLGVTAPNIVFYGPPGTGKTYLAKALATELGLPVALLSGADIQSKWINESASTVKTLFAEAREVASQGGGAVIFIDEVDSVLNQRAGSGNAHEEDTKVVNEFLGSLEDTGDHNIVFIGATNRIDALDSAGIRSGRVDKKIEIGKPDIAAREAILRAQLTDRRHSISGAEIAELAAVTDDAVAADLEVLIDNAAKNVLARGGTVIQPRDIG